MNYDELAETKRGNLALDHYVHEVEYGKTSINATSNWREVQSRSLESMSGLEHVRR